MDPVPCHQCAWGQCLLPGASFLRLSKEGSLLSPDSYHSPFYLQAKLKDQLEGIWLLGGKWNWQAKRAHLIWLRWQPHRTIIILYPPGFSLYLLHKMKSGIFCQKITSTRSVSLTMKNGFANSICGRYFPQDEWSLQSWETKLPGILGYFLKYTSITQHKVR